LQILFDTRADDRRLSAWLNAFCRGACLVVIALTSVAPWLGAAAAESIDATAQVRSFLESIYKHYPLAVGRGGFEPMGRSATQVFDPAMVALFKEDRRLTPRGDVGAVDWDPLCQCQDDDGLRAEIDHIALDGPQIAYAHVKLHFPSAADSVDFELRFVNRQWRIHDVKSKDIPSLRDLLIRANRERAKDGLKR
jgi:hypothetical protein